MLAAIRRFFDSHIAAGPDEPAGDERRVRVAAAALMVEVVRGDDDFSPVEREAVLDSAQRNFGLDDAEARELLALAEEEARGAHDYYQFTSRINDSFDARQKQRLIEELWRVAYADEVLHRHEEHLIRRLAELLHVPHSTFIHAKLKAQGP
jgi:uncharacterized tellurite resistance protein B-like protein